MHACILCMYAGKDFSMCFRVVLAQTLIFRRFICPAIDVLWLYKAGPRFFRVLWAQTFMFRCFMSPDLDVTRFYKSRPRLWTVLWTQTLIFQGFVVQELDFAFLFAQPSICQASTRPSLGFCSHFAIKILGS